MTRLFLLLVCPSFLGICASCSRFQRISPLEQDVIETAIAESDLTTQSSALQGLLDETSASIFFGNTDMAAELRRSAEGRDEVFHEALEDFIKANQGGKKELILARKLPHNLLLISQAELNRISRRFRTIWESDNAVKARYKGIGGIYEVSRPGLDSHRRIALICVTYSYSFSDVYGKFYVLKFDGAKWRVQKDAYFGPTIMS